MFCPRCGSPDQIPESYCRRCGCFLPDLSKPVKGPVPPEQHLNANITLSAMTIVVSFTMAILLWTILGFRGVHPLVYISAGLMFAIGCWHVQTLMRTILLRRHIKESKPPREEAPPYEMPIDNLLTPMDISDTVPPSVTERTTHKLVERLK